MGRSRRVLPVTVTVNAQGFEAVRVDPSAEALHLVVPDEKCLRVGGQRIDMELCESRHRNPSECDRNSSPPIQRVPQEPRFHSDQAATRW